MDKDRIDVFPLTAERWPDFEKLFGPSGACYGCWCVWWLMTNKEFNAIKGDGHKETMRTLVQQNREPGLLAYVEDSVAGWVAVAPRADYSRLKTSRNYAPLDEQPVWSIPCFFVDKKYRRKGLTLVLIQAATEYAKDHGARIVEAYPSVPEGKTNPMNIYKGLVSTFEKAGFVEVARRKPGHPVMRKNV